MKSRIYISIYILALLSACKQHDDTVSTTKMSIGISINTIEQVAGEPIRGVINGHNMEDITLMLKSLNGYHLIPLLDDSNSMAFDIPRELILKSGDYYLCAMSKRKIQDEIFFKIIPNQSDQLIEAFTGPKTIQIGSEEKALVVSIPKDEFNNPIADNSLIEYNINKSGVFRNEKIITKNLTAVTSLDGGDKTGKTLIGIQTQNSYSRENEFTTTPGWAENFKLELIEQYPFADSRQFYKIKTSVIKDGYGNIVSNGTLVQFILRKDAMVIGYYSGYTIGGIAQVAIQNPNTATDILVDAHCGVNKSNILTLVFKKAIDQLIVKQESGNIVIGPLYGALKQLVPDGFIIDVLINEKDQRIIETENGTGSLSLEDFEDGQYKAIITSGGMTEEINFTIPQLK